MVKKGFDSDGNRTGKGDRPKVERQWAPDSEFVQMELAAAEKQDLRKYAADIDGLDEALKDALEQDIKITIKTDERNACYVAFGFPLEGSDNQGFILTGRGGSPSRALRELLYKDGVILGHEWAGYHNRPKPDGEDDW